MNSVCSTDKRTGRWKKYGRTGPLSALAKWFYIHKDARVSERVDLGFSRERAETAEFIPAASGYISDNVVAFGLICNFLEDEERCDRWRSRWKSCRGRGHVGVPSNLQRDWRAGRDTRRGRPSLLLLFSRIFAAKNPLNARQEDPGGQRV